MNGTDARFYVSILLRRLPYLAAIVSSALVLTVIVASVLPPRYRASAKILVEAPQIPVELARSTVPIQAALQMQIIRQQITTRDDLLVLANKFDIYGMEKDELSGEDIVDDMRSRITFNEIGLNSPYGDPGASVASVSFTATDPDLAAKVVNELVDLMLEVVDGRATTPEQQMLLELNRALAEQSAMFSEDSPKIIALRGRIAALRAELRSKPVADGPLNGDKEGPSALDLQLSYFDERLRAIGRQKAAITQRIVELTTSLTATPDSENVLYSLERNRANLQKQYNTAITRRAEATIGDGGRFSVLERATPPETPESPKRRLIAVIGVLGGTGLAAAFIGLLEFFNETIRRPIELVRMLDRQPLATIPYIATAGEIRAQVGGKVAAVFAAATAPVALIATHYFYMPLPLAFQRVYQWLTALV
jgi:uncharacterized protein involved in exopolysaccharide biosynthesis